MTLITVRHHEWSGWRQTDDAGNQHQTCKWCKATRSLKPLSMRDVSQVDYRKQWDYQERGSALVLDSEPQCIERRRRFAR